MFWVLVLDVQQSDIIDGHAYIQKVGHEKADYNLAIIQLVVVRGTILK